MARDRGSDESAGQAVDAVVTTSGAVERMAKFGQHLAGRAELDRSEANGVEISAGIAEKILSAKSLDDVFEASESSLVGGRDLIDVEQRILGFDIRTSDDPEKQNPLTGNTYLVVHAVRLSNGEPFDWNTSATSLVTMLYKFEQLEAFPIDVVIKQKGQSNALTLKRVATRAV